jgi:hypothetical protein
MNSFRITFSALLLAAAGIAQASEISASPTPVSTQSRTDVAAQARLAEPSNEAWDGTQGKRPMAGAKTREQVRMEAAARSMKQQYALRDFYLGGM